MERELRVVAQVYKGAGDSMIVDGYVDWKKNAAT